MRSGDFRYFVAKIASNYGLALWCKAESRYFNGVKV
jgi:hypothetical protein